MKKINKGVIIKNLLVNSAPNLTLSDRRLYNYLLHHAFSKLPQQLDFSIPLDELIGVYGVSLPPIDQLKESLRKLIRTLIEFETVPRKWITTSLLENAEIHEHEEKLYYTYPRNCRLLFTDPFTLERCLIQAHFTQKYSNLLYELLSETLHANQTSVSLDIVDLRYRLHLSDHKFSNYSDLDRFVLTPALNEINSYANFSVKFKTVRKGMKVTHVVFEITITRNVFNVEHAKLIIPPKRPKFFIEHPEQQVAYAYLLNTETKERRKFFNLAVKNAAKKKITINEEEFDLPDLWFNWIEKELSKKID